MIHVIATITLVPGTRAAFLDAFRRLVPEVQREAGCLYYEGAVDLPASAPAQPPARPDVVVVVERWESPSALAAHAASPHMLAFRGQVKDYAAGTVLQILEPV